MKKLMIVLFALLAASSAHAYEGAWYLGGGLSLLDTGTETTRSSEPVCRKWYDCGTKLVVERQDWGRATGLSFHAGYQFPSGIMLLGTVTRYEGDSTGYRKMLPPEQATTRRGSSWAFGLSVLGRID